MIERSNVEFVARAMHEDAISRNTDGDDYPHWEETGDLVREAWRHNARAAIAAMIETTRDWRSDAEWMATYIMGRMPDRNTMTTDEIADYERKLREIVEGVADGIGKP